MTATKKNQIRWIVTATVTYWDAAWGDYVEVDLDHDSREVDAEAAEDDARGAWSDHGYSPDRVTVRPFAWTDE